MSLVDVDEDFAGKLPMRSGDSSSKDDTVQLGHSAVRCRRGWAEVAAPTVQPRRELHKAPVRRCIDCAVGGCSAERSVRTRGWRCCSSRTNTECTSWRHNDCPGGRLCGSYRKRQRRREEGLCLSSREGCADAADRVIVTRSDAGKVL